MFPETESSNLVGVKTVSRYILKYFKLLTSFTLHESVSTLFPAFILSSEGGEILVWNLDITE